MAIRTALLTSKNINLDTDFSKYIETVSEPGVIEGLAVTASSVATGIAWVLCERTNGETIYSLVQNFNAVSISGDGYVIITIPQNIVDNGGGNEDGTGIASIEVVNELPEKNYLLLATITGGVVEDNRNMIKKVWELSTEIDSIFAAIDDLDQRVDKLEAADAIDHLEERALVWENYALTDTLFKQLTPKLADSTVEANVGDVAANTQIHIQRLGSGTASNELKLKLKKTGTPAQDLVVEVRKWIKVDVSDAEAYWYGDENNIIATGTIAAADITTSWQELTVTLNNEFGGDEWELLDIVLYAANNTVNASNYYIVACDSTQWSEGFSYVCVNGTTRTRQKLMPYCVSSGFAQAMLSKEKTTTVAAKNSSEIVNSTLVQMYEDKFYTMYTNDTWGVIDVSLTITAFGKQSLNDASSKVEPQYRRGTSWGTAIGITWKKSDNTIMPYNWDNNDTTRDKDIILRETNLNNWEVLQIHPGNWRAYLYKRKTVVSISSDYNIPASSNIIKWVPRELKNIGKKASATLFWVHIDNTRITQDVE